MMSIDETQKKLGAIVDRFKEELAQVRVGRASPSLVENVPVEAYETTLSLKEVATISAPEPTLLVISPWDRSVIEEIVRAVNLADLGLSPVVDGENIRIPVPSLSEERRQEMVKKAKELAEEARIKVRGARQEAMKEVEKQEKDGQLSEDEAFRLKNSLQELVEETNQKISDLQDEKEKDLVSSA